MKDGETLLARDINELLECPVHAVVCDARGQVGRIAPSPNLNSTLPGGFHWAGAPGKHGISSAVFPLQVWWPLHSALIDPGGGGDG